MTDNDTGGNKNTPTDDERDRSTDTETPLAETLLTARREIAKLERQSAADRIRVEGADEYGGFSIRLDYTAELETENE